ncbi:hypothetical protein PVK06_020097 [Gossypium arboreum]|uniref:Uncharacterized protein n=1 Tax=Gossypium arboreum TaxID=29729 RepID=A0ABR0PLS0_GOSAR|nr:hypothetical protein PVK06_020097 [Gossypium arboreum]
MSRHPHVATLKAVLSFLSSALYVAISSHPCCDIATKPTTKNLVEALPEWKANLILHAQLANGPLVLNRVDFIFLRYLSTNSLCFNIYNPKGGIAIPRVGYRDPLALNVDLTCFFTSDMSLPSNGTSG